MYTYCHALHVPRYPRNAFQKNLVKRFNFEDRRGKSSAEGLLPWAGFEHNLLPLVNTKAKRGGKKRLSPGGGRPWQLTERARDGGCCWVATRNRQHAAHSNANKERNSNSVDSSRRGRPSSCRFQGLDQPRKQLSHPRYTTRDLLLHNLHFTRNLFINNRSIVHERSSLLLAPHPITNSNRFCICLATSTA